MTQPIIAPNSNVIIGSIIDCILPMEIPHIASVEIGNVLQGWRQGAGCFSNTDHAQDSVAGTARLPQSCQPGFCRPPQPCRRCSSPSRWQDCRALRSPALMQSITVMPDEYIMANRLESRARMCFSSTGPNTGAANLIRSSASPEAGTGSAADNHENEKQQRCEQDGIPVFGKSPR